MLSKASFELSEELFSKILKKKEKMGFKDKKWAEWFTILLDLKKNLDLYFVKKISYTNFLKHLKGSFGPIKA